MESNVALALAAALDPGHPIPIYLQIASAIRGEIATGRLPVGASLPSVRSLGTALGVNYHTVRHAWETLVEEGVLSVRRGRGALVVARPSTGDGWHLTSTAPDTTRDDPMVWVTAASWWHAASIARQVMAAWATVAAPWPLTARMPPPGTILLLDGETAPASWGARLRDLHPLATTLPRDAVGRIRRAADLLGTRAVGVVVTDAHNADAAVLLRQLPRIGLDARAITAATPPPPDRVLVVTPDGSTNHADPGVLALERTPAAGTLTRLARELGWRAV